MEKEKTDKLFKITLKGLYNSIGINYNVSYVVAKTSDQAYGKLRRYLDENDIGFERDREWAKIEFIAEKNTYTNMGTLLL